MKPDNSITLADYVQTVRGSLSHEDKRLLRKIIEEVIASTELGFLRLPKVLEIFPVSKSTWFAGIREGKFPKPVKLTERTSAWLRTDIEALCERLAATATPRRHGDCGTAGIK